MSIPVVNLAGTVNRAKRKIVDDLDRALQKYGTVLLAGHGVSSEAIAQMLHTTRAFFRLPLEYKRQASAPTPTRYRGYCAPKDVVVPGQPSELCESFEFNRYDQPEHAIRDGYLSHSTELLQPNIWPRQPPQFEAVCKWYFNEVESLMNNILRLLAQALQIDKDWFTDRFNPHCSYLCLNYYPPQTSPPQPGQLRQTAHTDKAGPTLLYQSTGTGGLQVQNSAGNWISVPCQPNTYVLLLGDLMAHWSNNKWTATLHRVVNPNPESASTERISLAYFSYPRLDTLIEPIPSEATPTNSNQDKPITVAEWARVRMQSSSY